MSWLLIPESCVFCIWTATHLNIWNFWQFYVNTRDILILSTNTRLGWDPVIEKEAFWSFIQQIPWPIRIECLGSLSCWSNVFLKLKFFSNGWQISLDFPHHFQSCIPLSLLNHLACFIVPNIFSFLNDDPGFGSTLSTRVRSIWWGYLLISWITYFLFLRPVNFLGRPLLGLLPVLYVL